MIVKNMQRYAQSTDKKSISTRLRRKRFSHLVELIHHIRKYGGRKEISIIDLGGTPSYWNQVYDVSNNPLNINVTLLNLKKFQIGNPFFEILTGDVTDMHGIPEQAYTIAFSNSLIEHLGDFSVQERLVTEMKRIAKYIYLQTPNYSFFWEPHYNLPFAHWISFSKRMKYLSFIHRTTVNEQLSIYLKNPIRLLTKSELQYFFSPERYSLRRENLFGFTKSYIVVSEVH